MTTDPDEALAQLVRRERSRVLATLVRVTGNLDLAEDSVQEAAVRALETWARDGVPANPRGWLLVTAKRKAIDVIRREARRSGKEAEAVTYFEPTDPEPSWAVQDDLLRLVFTCCHPYLSADAQVALALRTLAGYSTAEVARALLVSEATAGKRISRAKQKIIQAGIPYRVPSAAELPDRLAGVAATVYLIFNEGYLAGTGADLIRSSLTAEAIRLARTLVELMPDEPAALGLLALLVLQDSRRAARTDADGNPVLLADQDRSLWDVRSIMEGVDLTERALRRTTDRPDVYVIQAAIAVCHATARSAAETDWSAIVSWFDQLLKVRDSPVAQLNRAVAVAERDGPAAGLALVDAIDGLASYVWWHATRAELLRRLDRIPEARTAYNAALALDPNKPIADHLRRRLAD